MDTSTKLEDLEITLLLEAIFQRFGDDFRNHQKDLIQRKVRGFMLAHNIATISELQNKILHDCTYIEALLRTLDGRLVGLFDNPEYILELRKVLIPWLRSCPAPNIWIAECTAAEDVYTMAILLMEEGLFHKTRIFATSTNAILLNEARYGKFLLKNIAQYEENYLRAGGTASLANYYHQLDETTAAFHQELASIVTWAQYNLGTDSSFNEFELIICRGGLSEYTSRLRRRALQLFCDSLPTFGILSIFGTEYNEVVSFLSQYKTISPRYGLYRKIG